MWFIYGARSGKQYDGPFRDFKECEAAKTIFNKHARENNTEPVNMRYNAQD
jgi:hypothetical protein